MGKRPQEDQSQDISSNISEYLEEFKSGRTEVFNIIAEYYLPKLRAFACTLMYSKHDVDDAIQETLIRAYKNLNKFRGDAALSTWLCKILLNQVKTEYSKQQRLQNLQSEYQQSGLPEKFSTAAARECASGDFCQIIHSEIKKLPPAYSKILTLWLNGLTYSEIALHNNCSMGTVKSQLSRARRRLQHQLDKYKF